MRDRIAKTPSAKAQGSAPGGVVEPAAPWLRRVTFFSLLAGLCPLIPVPFLDDRVLDAVRRHQVRELARERGAALTPGQVDYLAGTVRGSRGCLGWLGWALWSLTVRLFAKLLRKVLLVFAVKESVDTASRTFHEGYLLHAALTPANPAAGAAMPPSDELAAWRVRRALEQALEEVDPRPVDQALKRSFRGSRRLLRRGARLLASPFRRRRAGRAGEAELPEAEEENLLGDVVDRLAGELSHESGYLATLEARFRARLEAGGGAGSDPAARPASPD